VLHNTAILTKFSTLLDCCA